MHADAGCLPVQMDMAVPAGGKAAFVPSARVEEATHLFRLPNPLQCIGARRCGVELTETVPTPQECFHSACECLVIQRKIKLTPVKGLAMIAGVVNGPAIPHK